MNDIVDQSKIPFPFSHVLALLCFRGANARDFKTTKKAQGQQGTQGLLCTKYL